MKVRAGCSQPWLCALVHLGFLLGGVRGKVLTVNRIDRATKPTVSAEDCGGFDESSTNGPGAAATWCKRVLDAVVAKKEENGLVGLSYGILTWDTWSAQLANAYGVPTELYDCYAEVERNPSDALLHYKAPSNRHEICLDGRTYKQRDGRRFEAFSEHMEARKGRRTIVKMDIEGSEWAALGTCSDECLQQIDLLDLEIHFCEPPSPSLPKIAEVLERLLQFFAVTGRATGRDLPFDVNVSDDVPCHPKPNGEVYPGMACVSYVNKARLAEVQPTTPTPTMMTTTEATTTEATATEATTTTTAATTWAWKSAALVTVWGAFFWIRRRMQASEVTVSTSDPSIIGIPLE